MRNTFVTALLAGVSLCGLTGTAFGQSRPSWVNANANAQPNANPPPLADEKVIFISGNYDCGREAGQTTDNLPVKIKVNIETIEKTTIGGKPAEIITLFGEDTLFPQPSTGSYSSKNFYLKANPGANTKYRISVTLEYTQVGGGGNATRTATINNYLP